MSLSLKSGEVLGILGPNGAGKTTLLEIIEGLQDADVGFVSIFGRAPHQSSVDASLLSSGTTGAMLQYHSLPRLLKVAEIIDVYALLYDGAMARGELLRSMDLVSKEHARISSLSIGQRQRLAFGLAVIGRPQLLFLDEPTASLDPQGRRFVWDFVSRARAERRTATLLTTHSMEEAQTLCDRVIILDKGRIADQGTPNDLIHKHCPGYRIRVQCFEEEFEQLCRLSHQPLHRDAAGVATLSTLGLEACLQSLQQVIGVGIETRIRNVEQNTLEDVFLKLTGKELRD